jgi:ketosteroid isomerase-like protein
MPEILTNLHRARLYLKSIENGEFPSELLSPDVQMQQLPNRIYPKGVRAGASQMAEAFNRGKKLLSSQSYDIKNAVENGNCVALEVQWTGKLAIPFGSLEAGSEIRAHCAMFLEFSDGKIISQRNYDCFEPW